MLNFVVNEGEDFIGTVSRTDVRRARLQTTRSCFDTVISLPASSLKNATQATIALSGEKRGPEVYQHPWTANQANLYGVDMAKPDHTVRGRPPDPPGDIPIGYRALCGPRRHG